MGELRADVSVTAEVGNCVWKERGRRNSFCLLGSCSCVGPKVLCLLLSVPIPSGAALGQCQDPDFCLLQASQLGIQLSFLQPCSPLALLFPRFL